jgi:hypothetical protein
MPVALNAQNHERPGSSAVVLPRLARTFQTACALLSLLLLCSCATAPHSAGIPLAGKLPAGVKMNKDAGRGSWLFVTLRLESGEELPFFLDTGASGTCFDKSLEPILGKRLGTDTSWHFGVEGDAGVHGAPKLYLGGAPLLMTGTNVATIDLELVIGSEVGHPIAGVLGMDVLEHYWIQLDFGANEIRFLDGEHTNRAGWGKPFSLPDLGEACPVIRENLDGSQTPGSLIDTGCNSDGWLGSALFEQWTNPALPATNGQARSPNGLLAGETHPEIDVQRLDENMVSSGDSHMKFNGIGLRFLARHLVTLDFPKRTLYLKRTSTGPLSLTVKEQRAEGRSVYKFLASLKKRGQLPGWSTTDRFPRSATFHCHTLSSGTLELLKKGDSGGYHYRVTRASEHSPRKLRKAWQTDENGRTMAEYSVP